LAKSVAITSYWKEPTNNMCSEFWVFIINVDIDDLCEFIVIDNREGERNLLA